MSCDLDSCGRVTPHLGEGWGVRRAVKGGGGRGGDRGHWRGKDRKGRGGGDVHVLSYLYWIHLQKLCLNGCRGVGEEECCLMTRPAL